MQTQVLNEWWTELATFLPALMAGLLVIVAGIVAGWLVKRALVRMLIWLRLDRLADRVGWRSAFSKGDVRQALYNIVGNVVGISIVLVFVDDALNRWGLTTLSRFIDSIVFYIPNLMLVGVIVGVGLMLSSTLAQRVSDALEEEGIRRARLVGKVIKAALIAVVAALALWQLHFAREIILAAFVISFGSIGVAFAIGAGLGSSRAIQQSLVDLLDRKRDGEA
jgi:Mechanosensitive ion channel, conserved TM helix